MITPLSSCPLCFPLYKNSKSHWNKTIHGLIYNALKLFMEMNQKLFDECTQQYKLELKKEKEKAKQRIEAWKKLDHLARNNPDIDRLSAEMRSCVLNDTIDMMASSVSMDITESSDNLAKKAASEDIVDSSSSSSAKIISPPSGATSSVNTSSSLSSRTAGTASASAGSNAGTGNKPADKPLLRRKSELPTDVYTQQALESHKRADEYLTTPPDANKA